VRQDKPKATIKRSARAQDGYKTPEPDSLDTLAARLSPAELNELVATLPDQGLAHLVVAAVRQLRRRLARAGRQAGRRRAPSPLERAARELVVELGEHSGDDAF